MFEYILIFTLGFFIGYGIDDIDKENQKDIQMKNQEMILNKIKEDRAKGYVPDFDTYEELYNKYGK